MVLRSEDSAILIAVQDEMNNIVKKEIGPRKFTRTGEVLEDMQKDIYLISKAISDLCHVLINSLEVVDNALEAKVDKPYER